MTGRRSWDSLWMSIAMEMSTMGTCVRRQVGCVLVNGSNKLLGTGFNGVPPKWPHCSDGQFCPGAKATSGTELDLCYALHAEQNALAHCSDRWRIATAYVTVSPCVRCVKDLLQSSCRRIVFTVEYPQPEAGLLWLRGQGNVWAKLANYDAAPIS